MILIPGGKARDSRPKAKINRLPVIGVFEDAGTRYYEAWANRQTLASLWQVMPGKKAA